MPDERELQSMGDEAAHEAQATRPEEQVADEETLRALRAASPELQKRWEGDDPYKWYRVKWGDGRVRELDLYGCPLKELPAQVGLLTGLTKLELRKTQLTALPAELGQLTGLTTLHFDRCPQLTALPAELGQLTGLTTLDLHYCEQLTALPAELGRLTGLTALNINVCTQLTALPAELGRLTGLAKFSLSGCKRLTMLPAELIALATLDRHAATLIIVEPRKGTPEQLHDFLRDTPLAVPGFFKYILTDRRHRDWLGKAVEATPTLGHLTVPDDGRTISTVVQEQVADEETLRALRDASPELQERWEGDDPSEWRGVKWGDGRVRGLDLDRCPLKELPAQVGLLTGLTTLSLEWCKQLTALPAELGRLTGLTTLNLQGCEQLTELPAELGLLTGLTSLNLSNCEQLTALPAELGQLVNLTSLGLGYCKQLKELPAELGLLVNLTGLGLRLCTQLTALPAKLGQLTGLTTLYLSDCMQLTALPAELGQLLNLTTLVLGGCDQLTLPLGAPADAKKTTSAPPTIAAYAPLLIVEPRKDTPGQLHAFLLATPLAVHPFFKSVLTDATHAEWLGKAVVATPDLARLTDPDGRRAIDVAHPACKQKMQAALYLFGCYDVDDGPLLHRSATSTVAAADDHADPEAKPVPRVALKAMRQPEQVLAELKGRVGLSLEHVISIKAVFADEAVDAAAWKRIKDAAVEIDVKAVAMAPGLSGLVQAHLFPAMRAGPGKKLQKSGSVTAINTSEYSFLLVLELADRSLSHTVIHEHIAGEDFPAIRHIADDVVRALAHVHAEGAIHADGKPLNAVAVGTTWKLIDFDVSCKIGEPFGDKVPSSGYCPPEFARVLLQATDDQGRVDGAKLAEYVASEAYDLWSIGTVLYHLVFGRSLWNNDVNDNVKPADLRKLAAVPDAPLRRALDAALADGERRNASVDLKVATALLRKLLEPDAEKRMAHFPKGVLDVLEEPFFQGQTLDAATLNEIKANQVKMIATQEKMMTKLDVLADMSEEHRAELLLSRKVLIKAVLEATEVLTPTTFVILEEKLPSEEEEDSAETVKKRFDTGVAWVQRLQTFGEGVIEGDADKVFGQVKEVLGKLVTKKTMYFYLVDELTGKPVRGAGYPIKITTPLEIVHKLLPVMQVGMRAMSLYSGVAGIAHMFGAPVPTVPKEWREGAQSSVELLKQESSVEAFGAVHAAVQEGGEKQETTRGASLRELQRLLEKEDPDKGYAGLRRVGGDDGTALWTLLKDEQVTAKLDERAKERREEERRHDGFVRAQLAMLAAAPMQEELPSAPAASSPSLVEAVVGADTQGSEHQAQQEASRTVDPSHVQASELARRAEAARTARGSHKSPPAAPHQVNDELERPGPKKSSSCCVIG